MRGRYKIGFSKVIPLNKTENQHGNKKGLLWLQTTHMGLPILHGLMSVIECLLCWRTCSTWPEAKVAFFTGY